MNDRFKRKDGTRHSTEAMVRVQRRFRQHVRNQSTPRGRVHREECCFCVRLREDQLTPSEAHHESYDTWWRVVWLCTKHHRMVDHGSLRVRVRDVWDYGSLLRPLLRASRPTAKYNQPAEEVPF